MSIQLRLSNFVGGKRLTLLSPLRVHFHPQNTQVCLTKKFSCGAWFPTQVSCRANFCFPLPKERRFWLSSSASHPDEAKAEGRTSQAQACAESSNASVDEEEEYIQRDFSKTLNHVMASDVFPDVPKENDFKILYYEEDAEFVTGGGPILKEHLEKIKKDKTFRRRVMDQIVGASPTATPLNAPAPPSHVIQRVASTVKAMCFSLIITTLPVYAVSFIGLYISFINGASIETLSDWCLMTYSKVGMGAGSAEIHIEPSASVLTKTLVAFKVHRNHCEH